MSRGRSKETRNARRRPRSQRHNERMRGRYPSDIAYTLGYVDPKNPWPTEWATFKPPHGAKGATSDKPTHFNDHVKPRSAGNKEVSTERIARWVERRRPEDNSRSTSRTSTARTQQPPVR